MRNVLASIALLGALITPPPAAAQVYNFCNNDCPTINAPGQIPTFPIKRFAGSATWFDPARPGSGWAFHELPRRGLPPVGIGVSYTYETSGAPTWLYLQGSFTTETDPRRILDGHPIEVFNAPVVDGEGGGCPTCPWTTPNFASRRYATGQVTFLRPDLATVRLDGQVANSGEATLIPTELDVSVPMPGLLEGRWRFTRRVGQFNGTYDERNFATHRCELTITAVPSPSRDHQFTAANGQSLFWLPPSGAHVRWLKIDHGILCFTSGNLTNPDLHIAYEPGSPRTYRAIELASVTPLTAPGGPIGTPPIVTSFTVAQFSRFTELFVQDVNTVILRRYSNNNPSGPTLLAEYLLTRAP